MNGFVKMYPVWYYTKVHMKYKLQPVRHQSEVFYSNIVNY